MTASTLEIRDLAVRVEEKEILKGLSLTIRSGEIHALMGPNGSGKSTLAYALMGHPAYEITGGKILLDGEDITELSPEERAQRGLFLGFQYPVEVKGVRLSHFLWTAYRELRKDDGLDALAFRKKLSEVARDLRMEEEILDRGINEGFSGGERKRAEVLQMAVLEPKFAVMDETDSGLDIDALRVVADAINAAFQRAEGRMGVLLITHYQRILQYVRPHFVHVLVDGRIVRSGGYELSEELEARGYEGLLATREG